LNFIFYLIMILYLKTI